MPEPIGCHEVPFHLRDAVAGCPFTVRNWPTATSVPWNSTASSTAASKVPPIVRQRMPSKNAAALVTSSPIRSKRPNAATPPPYETSLFTSLLVAEAVAEALPGLAVEDDHRLARHVRDGRGHARVSNSPPTTQRPFQSVDAIAAVARVGPV
jgi:hypothetical protein